MPSESETAEQDVLHMLRTECCDVPWTGPGGLFGKAANEIERLRDAMMSVQRSAFDAGYDAARDGQSRSIAYLVWSNGDVPND